MKDSSNMTALMYASQNGLTSMVGKLLHNDVEMDTKDGDQRTSLMLALSEGHEPAAELILGRTIMGAEATRSAGSSNGTGPDATSMHDFGVSAFMASASLAALLVSSVSSKALDAIDDDEKQSILMYASKGGCIGVVRRLLKHEVKVGPTDKLGRTSLILAVLGGYEEVAELLLGPTATAIAPNAKYAVWLLVPLT